MKKTALKPFKRKPGVKYWPGTNIIMKSDAKPIRKISKIQSKKIQNYRKVGFENHGEVCFLCGRTKTETRLVIHHFDCKRYNDSPDNLFPLCHHEHGCMAHNHMGAKGLKELNQKILDKLNS
jgi:hypothetical protein